MKDESVGGAPLSSLILYPSSFSWPRVFASLDCSRFAFVDCEGMGYSGIIRCEPTVVRCEICGKIWDECTGIPDPATQPHWSNELLLQRGCLGSLLDGGDHLEGSAIEGSVGLRVGYLADEGSEAADEMVLAGDSLG